MRPSGRAPDQLRPVSLEPGFSRHAEGSCLVKFGDTHVLCTASVDERVPPWMRNTGKGWVTAEYGMLPRSTHTRTDREAARGKQSGRTQEIQRLIGRSLRAVVDLTAMGERQINIDCDVLQADGGTRTAAITGSWVALHFAFERLIKEGKLTANPVTGQVAAVSCGLWEGTPVLDLDYPEDSKAQADANFVLTGSGGIVEVQGTAEDKPFSEPEFIALLELAKKGIGELTRLQRLAIGKSVMARRFVGPKLVVATHNRGKAGEIRTMLSRFGVEIVSAADLGLPAPEETGTTFEENATLKALAATRASGLPALADDSGLSVAALDGQPGLHTADWEGPTRDAMVGMKRIQDELAKRKVPDTDAARGATFHCVLALAWPDEHVELVHGTLDGRIVWPPRGSGGHGYDPCFQPKGDTRTTAEMTDAEKNAISHRGRAFRMLVEACFK